MSCLLDWIDLSGVFLVDGISVCVEQGFVKAEYMFPFIELAKELGVKILVYQIEAPRNVLVERLTTRKTPSEAKTPVSMDKVERNLDNYFNNKYSEAKVIDSEKHSPDKIVQIILNDLASS